MSKTNKIKRVWRFPNNRDDRIATADIDFTTCTGRRLSNVLGGPGPDVRVSASAAVYGETQCKFPVIDGGDLCKTCEGHRSRGGKYWNGHIYDPPSDTTHMIGSRWAEGNVIWLEPPAAPRPRPHQHPYLLWIWRPRTRLSVLRWCAPRTMSTP
jgi:hypothetical protein